MPGLEALSPECLEPEPLLKIPNFRVMRGDFAANKGVAYLGGPREPDWAPVIEACAEPWAQFRAAKVGIHRFARASQTSVIYGTAQIRYEGEYSGRVFFRKRSSTERVEPRPAVRHTLGQGGKRRW